MDDDKAELLPFHAINEFMRNDYRLSVVRTTLHALAGLPEIYRKRIDQLTRKTVRVAGFRNSEKAPSAVKAAPMAEAFEKSPELVAAILDAWAVAHADLRREVYELLTGRGWDLLPIEAERTKLPGFFVKWPKEEDFETLHKAFAEQFPGVKTTDDDISLMIVWVSMRLPVQMVEKEETRLYKRDQPSQGAEE